MAKPKVFIGSSKESIEFARAIELQLRDLVSASIWDGGFINLHRTTREEMLKVLHDVDFAILVFTSNDLVSNSSASSPVLRDNLIFELGHLVGHLGMSRTFFVCSEYVDLQLGPDLAGITYSISRTSGAPHLAVKGACARIRREIRKEGILKPLQSETIINRIRMSKWEDIYARAARLVTQAESRVRATSFGISTSLQGAKLEYFKSIAKRAAEQKRRHQDFIYKVVCSKNNPHAERDSALRERREIFNKYNVPDCLHVKEIEDAWGIDLLIVDEDNLHISFQRLADNHLGLGLELTDAEELVRPIAIWYDECLFGRAAPFDWNNLL